MKNVWIINEGSPGHLSQSVGFSDILGKLYSLRVVEVYGRTTLRGWQRHFVRFLMGSKGRAIPLGFLSKLADFTIPDNAVKPDLIVSSGGKSVFTGHALAFYYKVPYVFIGERKPYPSHWFTAVFTPVEAEIDEKTYLIDFIPTPVTPALIEKSGQLENGIWCMIIGGRSRSCPFTEHDWRALAHGMNQLAESSHIRWLITTSRRTGNAAEMLLQQELKAEFIHDAIWWADKPRRELYNFMARSEVLFVTQDSVTMVTEAVSSGRPVVGLGISHATEGKESVQEEYFKRLAQKKYIQSISIRDLGEADISSELKSKYQDDLFISLVKDVFSDIWALDQ